MLGRCPLDRLETGRTIVELVSDLRGGHLPETGQALVVLAPLLASGASTTLFDVSDGCDLELERFRDERLELLEARLLGHGKGQTRPRRELLRPSPAHGSSLFGRVVARKPDTGVRCYA